MTKQKEAIIFDAQGRPATPEDAARLQEEETAQVEEELLQFQERSREFLDAAEALCLRFLEAAREQDKAA